MSIGLPLQLYIGAADCSCQNATLALVSPYSCILVVHIVAVRMWSFASIGLPLQLYIGAADCSCQNATPALAFPYYCILVECIGAVRMLCEHWSPLLLYIGAAHCSCQNGVFLLLSWRNVQWLTLSSRVHSYLSHCYLLICQHKEIHKCYVDDAIKYSFLQT